MRKIEQEDLFLLGTPDEQLDFPKWLRKRWLIYHNEHNGFVSQNDYAKHLGISNANLTNYMTNLRRPSAEFVETLADALGPQVYDKLDLPRKMPKNKDVLYVVDAMADFTEAERKELLEHVRNMRDKRKKRERQGNGEVMA